MHNALCYCIAMSTSSGSGASASPKAKGRGKGRNQSPAMLALNTQKEAVAKNLRDVRSGMREDSCSVSSVYMEHCFVKYVARFDCQHTSVMLADF